MNEFIEKIRKYSDYCGEDGAEDAAVEAAEKALGLTFAEDYREYLLECGAACADGHIFTGINTVAETTALWRSRHPGITDGMYAVEIFEQDGIAAWQNGSGVSLFDARRRIAAQAMRLYARICFFDGAIIGRCRAQRNFVILG